LKVVILASACGLKCLGKTKKIRISTGNHMTLVHLDILLVTRYELRAGIDELCTAACKRLLVQSFNDIYISGDFNKLVHAPPYT
jgi:hypothetical protein